MSVPLDICEAIDGPSPEWYREAADAYAPPREGTDLMNNLNGLPESKPSLPGASQPPTIKGARKVDGFPERCKYPFRQIASDGGVWKIDPAKFNAKAPAVYTAARKWATDHGMTCKVVTDDGLVYVQFTPGRHAVSAQSLRVHGSLAGGSPRNGLPEGGGYVYRGGKRDEPDDPALKAQRQEMGRRAVQARIARKAAREAET